MHTGGNDCGGDVEAEMIVDGALTSMSSLLIYTGYSDPTRSGDLRTIHEA